MTETLFQDVKRKRAVSLTFGTDPVQRKTSNSNKHDEYLRSLRDLNLINSSLDLSGSLSNLRAARGVSVKSFDRKSTGSETERDEAGRRETRGREGFTAWFLLSRVFLYNLVSGLTWSTFSLYYVQYTQYFNSSKGTVGWIVSFQATLSYLLGIFVSAPIEAFGIEKCAAFGGLVYSIGLGLSCFAPSVAYLYITQGLISGIGLSFVYIVGPIVIQRHFHTNRTLANGLGILGYSAGQLIGPVLVNALISEFGWRGAILLHGAISLNTVPLGLTLKSPSAYNKPEYKLKITSMLKEATDFSLLRQRKFLFYFIAGFFGRYHNQALLQHIPSRAVSLGVSVSKAAYLVSIIYLCNTSTRAVVSLVANINGCNRTALMTLGYALEGMADVCMLTIPGYAGSMAGSVVFGLSMGLSNTLATVVVVDLVGIGSLARGLGLHMFAQSFALLISAPLTGWIYDVTKDYDVAFYVSLCSAIICVSFMLTVVGLRQCEKAKHERDEESSHVTE